MYRHRRFSGDPHPGNMIRMADGRVAFLDFGLFKELGVATRWSSSWRRAAPPPSATPPSSTACWTEGGFLPEPDKVAPEDLFAYVEDAIWWYMTDEQVQITPEAVQRIAIQAGDPRSTHFRTMRHQDMNPEHLIGRRLELLVLAVLGELQRHAPTGTASRASGCTATSRSTELGRQEAEFLASRGGR